MGLTVHFALTANRRNPLSVLNALREKALDLPFDGVSEIHTFEGLNAQYENHEDYEIRWALIQGCHHTPDLKLYDGNFRECKVSFQIAPTRLSVFTIEVGNGSEPINIGLADYPSKVEYDNYSAFRGWSSWRPYVYKVPHPKGSWRAFCKTQFAYEHGVEHFLRCHLAMIALLDYAKSLKALSWVHDEGEFWETRNIPTLLSAVEENQALIAAFTSAMQRMIDPGQDVISPVQDNPNFMALAEEGRLNSPMLRKLFGTVGAAA